MGVQLGELQVLPPASAGQGEGQTGQGGEGQGRQEREGRAEQATSPALPTETSIPSHKWPQVSAPLLGVSAPNAHLTPLKPI